MTDNAVQLGFAIPLHGAADDDESDASESHPAPGHRSPRWFEWDGGKIGGRPSWLNPRDLPGATLRCHRCGCEGREGTILRFVAQLYCPADESTGNEAAFHRSLYVFACPKCCSAQKSAAEHESSIPGCVRVLRCQLPKANDFYPPAGDGASGDESWTKHTSQYWAEHAGDDKLNNCAVCGQRSKGKCPKQRLWFCGPDHQKEYLRASKNQLQQQKQQDDDSKNDGVADVKYLPSVCYESELVVEDEPAFTIAHADTFKKETDEKSKNTFFQSKEIDDADAELEQSDLNALTGNASLAQAATGVTDPMTLSFYARMAIGGEENDVRDQCLRYCRWPETSEETQPGEEEDGGGPLWISSIDLPPSRPASPSFPPPCQYCGAPRSFEFQILPQMLHYLLQSPGGDANDESDERSPRHQVLTESERAVLLEAKSKIESGVDLPEGFLEQHEAAVANAREALLGISSNRNTSNGSNGGSGDGTSKGGLDWGTVAVYTCTASCGDGGVVSRENGAYREEAAWVQPPLD